MRYAGCIGYRCRYRESRRCTRRRRRRRHVTAHAHARHGSVDCVICEVCRPVLSAPVWSVVSCDVCERPESVTVFPTAPTVSQHSGSTQVALRLSSLSQRFLFAPHRHVERGRGWRGGARSASDGRPRATSSAPKTRSTHRARIAWRIGTRAGAGRRCGPIRPRLIPRLCASRWAARKKARCPLAACGTRRAP